MNQFDYNIHECCLIFYIFALCNSNKTYVVIVCVLHYKLCSLIPLCLYSLYYCSTFTEMYIYCTVCYHNLYHILFYNI